MIKKGLENQRKNSQQLELKNEKTLKEISKIKRSEKAKGITLIALIITIIILIILAGITMVALSGENGILRQASKAKEETAKAEEKEQEDLKELEKIILANIDPWTGNVASNYSSGTGEETDPYIIENAEQLAYLAEQVNNGETYEGKYFKIVNSINLGGMEWTPIGGNKVDEETFEDINWETDKQFKGILDGQGNIIANLRINKQNSGEIGLIGALGETGVVRNIKISSGNIVGLRWVGAIAGVSKGTIENCTNLANVKAVTIKGRQSSGIYPGGIAGANNKGVIENVYNEGKVEAVHYGKDAVGGIVGMNRDIATINYSYNKGELIGEGYKGGIIGNKSKGTVEKCYYYSDIITKGIGNQENDVPGVTEKVEDNIETYEEFLTWIEGKKE